MSVVFRQITTGLERKCRAPGGKKVSEAIADARQNLESLGERALRLIDEGVVKIRRLVDVGDGPVTDGGLAEIHAIADGLMGYCVAVDRPHLPECLYTLCELADAVRRSRIWLPGTFEPMLLIILLAVRGTLTNPECRALLGGVRLCIDRYLAEPRAT